MILVQGCVVGGGGYPWKVCVGVCGILCETLTLFWTKISDFPAHPISDLNNNKKLASAKDILNSRPQF